VKILIHSNAPWVPSGYGRQCALLLPQLAKLGHEPAVSCFHGLSGSVIHWEGYPMFPAGQAPFGTDVLIEHARTYEAELILTLMDFWQLLPIARDLGELGQLGGCHTAVWLPNDCRPVAHADRAALAMSRAVPIGMSRWAMENLEKAGFSAARYVPHMVDGSVFAPMPAEERAEYRRNMGAEGRFVIGIMAANRDAVRKAFPEQFRAFAEFRLRHPEANAVLWVHTITQGPGGYNLVQMAEDMGITDAVQFSDQYPQVAGLLPDSALVPWFNCLDVLSNCSYAEAFGIPIIEAQACGTPVVVTHGSAMTELCGSGWTVHGDPFYNAVHRAWWTRPEIPDILAGYERAWSALRTPRGAARVREKARRFALAYEVGRVVPEHWAPALDALEAL